MHVEKIALILDQRVYNEASGHFYLVFLSPTREGGRDCKNPERRGGLRRREDQ